jgi:hypothetical protein
MRKLEAASVRKMLHRRRMRRRGGVGKGSGLVTGEDWRAMISDCRDPKEGASETVLVHRERIV